MGSAHDIELKCQFGRTTSERNNHDVSIICVTEIWFKYCMDDNNLSIEGFSVERKDISDGRTGVESPATLGIASRIKD